jgi:ascorbate-specific PTS system EIIC-type component UlaA
MDILEPIFTLLKRITPACRVLITGHSGFEESAQLVAAALERGIDEFALVARVQATAQLVVAAAMLLDAIRKAHEALATHPTAADMPAETLRTALLSDLVELQQVLTNLLTHEVQTLVM